MLTIALFGDSIGRGVSWDEERGRYAVLKEGFDKLMEAEGAARILNRSRFGATAAEGLLDFEAETALEADALHPPKTGLEAFEEILTRFVKKVRERNMLPILVTPPPLVTERFVPWVSRGLDEGAILRYLGDIHHVYRWQEQYALAVHRAARHAQCLLFDVRAWFLRERDLGSLYCVDGMHPNAKGHRLIASAAAAQLPELAAAL